MTKIIKYLMLFVKTLAQNLKKVYVYIVKNLKKV